MIRGSASLGRRVWVIPLGKTLELAELVTKGVPHLEWMVREGYLAQDAVRKYHG
jgi:hypothetical protein